MEGHVEEKKKPISIGATIIGGAFLAAISAAVIDSIPGHPISSSAPGKYVIHSLEAQIKSVKEMF